MSARTLMSALELARHHSNYQVFAAGRLWMLDSATLTTLPDGSEAISPTELSRIHKAIANAICGTAGHLSFAAFEFLCDITGATFSGAAIYLGIDKSTVSTWRRRGLVPSKLVGNALKRWFWFKLFGDSLGKTSLPISTFASDLAFLETASKAAISANLSDKAVLKRAS